MKTKKVADDIKKEGVTGEINKIIIGLSGKEELVIYLNNENEINKATLNGEPFLPEKIKELLEKLGEKISVKSTSPPPCPWYIDRTTLQKFRICLPGYVCY